MGARASTQCRGSNEVAYERRFRDVAAILTPAHDACDSTSAALMVMQLLPYHSKAFGPLSVVRASQRYSFYLIEQAIRDGNVIIMRSRATWPRAVPALREYPYMALPFPRNPRIALPHLTPSHFDVVAKALASAL